MTAKEILLVPGIIALIGIFAVGALSLATIKAMAGAAFSK